MRSDEAVSRYLEDHAGDFAFWDKLGKEDPGLLKKLWQAMQRMLRFGEANTMAERVRHAMEAAMVKHGQAMSDGSGTRAAVAQSGKQTKIGVRGKRRVVRKITTQQESDLGKIIKKRKLSTEDASQLTKFVLDTLERFPTEGVAEEPWAEVTIVKAGFTTSKKGVLHRF